MVLTDSRGGLAEGTGDLGLEVAPSVVRSSASTVGVATNFSGHETFAFRYTWLKKGVDAFTADAEVFRSKRAIVTLSVGKNIVSSIRYWAGATRVFEETEAVPGSRVKALAVSPFGRRLRFCWLVRSAAPNSRGNEFPRWCRLRQRTSSGRM